MRLDYLSYSESFKIKDNTLNDIIIESSHMFFDLVEAIYYSVIDESDEVRLWYNGEQIKITKEADVIISPYSLTFNKRDIQKKMLDLLIDELIYSGIDEAMTEINQRILGIVSDAISGFEYSMNYSNELSIQDIVKSIGIKPRNPEGSFTERLIEYIETLHRILNKRIFFIINCKSYIDKEDYSFLEKFSSIENITMIFVERNGGLRVV